MYQPSLFHQQQLSVYSGSHSKQGMGVGIPHSDYMQAKHENVLMTYFSAHTTQKFRKIISEPDCQFDVQYGYYDRWLCLSGPVNCIPKWQMGKSSIMCGHNTLTRT